jgi:hypothetical protein
MGSYVTLVSLLILVPDKNEAGRVPEAYDGNIWEYFIWKRSNIMFTAVFLMFFELATIQFSFSDIYGNNAWVMMGVFKVVEIVVEGELEKSVSEALMLSTLQVSFAVVLGLTGFGADNFLDFLQGYFIDVGISMFERPYFDSVFEVVQGSYEDYFPKISRAFAKWVDIKDDEEEVKKDEANKRANSKDEEEKEWDFKHLDHVLTQITSQQTGIGGIMAAMIYQIDQDAKQKTPTAIKKEASNIKLEDGKDKKSNT